MKYFAKILIIGLIQMNVSSSLLAASMGENDIKVTIYPTNSTISVGATNIPAKVTIENISNEDIVFYFAASEMIGRGVSVLDGVTFDVPVGGKVRLRELLWGYASFVTTRIELKPGEKYTDDVNLGRFLEFTGMGECEVGFKGNLRLYPKGFKFHRHGKQYKEEESPGRVVPFHGVIKVTVQEKQP